MTGVMGPGTRKGKGVVNPSQSFPAEAKPWSEIPRETNYNHTKIINAHKTDCADSTAKGGEAHSKV